MVFRNLGLCLLLYRNVSPAPFCLLNHSWIYLQWLLFPSQCELQVSSWLVTNCIHSLFFDFLGALGKLCRFLSNCMRVLLKFPSTSRQKCVWIGRQTAKLLAILGMGFCCLVYNFLSTGSDTSDQIRSDQSLSRVRPFATPWIAACQASLSTTNSQCSLRLTSIESVIPFSHLTLCRPLLLLPSILPSIRVFFNVSTLRMRWPKYWSFSFSIIPSKEIPGLVSFRMDWLDVFAVQGTLKSLLQHYSSKASILQRSAFFTVQLWHPYVTTGKTIALTRRTFVGKVMSLLLNMLSRLAREGSGNPLQYSCLENPMDGEAW